MPVPEGISVVESGPQIGNPLIAALVSPLFFLAARLEADVFIGSMPTLALVAYMKGWLSGRPAVNYVLGDDLNFFDDGTLLRSRLLRRLYRQVALFSLGKTTIVVNSHWTATRVVAAVGRRPIAIVPGGYDLQSFYLVTDHADESGVINILTIGRRMRSKGLPDLLTALKVVQSDGVAFRLTVATNENLTIDKPGFACEVVRPADDAELADLYRRADIFVHPSWAEGFGLPPLEALATGVAVVATDSGGIREFLRDEVNALIVPPREPQTIADAIIRLARDRDLRARLASGGIDTRDRFTWDHSADALEAVLDKIVREHHAT